MSRDKYTSNDGSTSMTSKDGRCIICGEVLAGASETVVRKHAKSRVHRRALATFPGKKEEELSVSNSCSVEAQHEKREAISSKSCLFCCSYHDADLQYRGMRSEQIDYVCFPPPFLRSPRPRDLDTPFVTGSIGSTGASWHGENWKLGEIIQWGCGPGNWRRLPNIDIDGKNVCIENWGHARELLEDKLTECGDMSDSVELDSHPHSLACLNDISSTWVKETENVGAWISFDAGDELSHPKWFLKTSSNAKNDVQLVPNYSNVIVTMGGCMTIGLHQDTDNQRNVEKHSGTVSAPGPCICTYLKLAQGAKHVLLLPPKSDKHILEFFDRTWTGNTFKTSIQNELEMDPGSSEHDSSIAAREYGLNMLRKVGGYTFRMMAGFTLLIPRGWYHWLIAEPSHTVTLSGSRY